MSLAYDYRNVINHEKIDDEGLRGVLDSLIWGTLIVGMGSIDAEASSKCYYKRFAARLSFAQKLNGYFLHNSKKEVPITEKHVKRFIGLKTNVSYETPTAWLRHFMRSERASF